MNLGPLEQSIQDGIVAGLFPGAAFAVITEAGAEARYLGEHSPGRGPRIGPETLWDLASLTKVVATGSAAMILHDRGLLELDEPLARVLPDFGAYGKDYVTVRQVLLHSSGLVPFRHTHDDPLAPDPWTVICHERLRSPPGGATEYSDLGFIALGKWLERSMGVTLGEACRKLVFEPLDMASTGFNPQNGSLCAPTGPLQPWHARLALRSADESWLQGLVHDPTAALMGGIAGHAGLFSNLPDLCRFAQVMLTGGQIGGRQWVSPETLGMWTTAPSPLSSRALAWDTPSPGSSAGTKMSDRAFGHTGFTGTSIWIDPGLGFAAILLTNRVHPDPDNLGIKSFRPQFHDLVVEGLG